MSISYRRILDVHADAYRAHASHPNGGGIEPSLSYGIALRQTSLTLPDTLVLVDGYNSVVGFTTELGRPRLCLESVRDRNDTWEVCAPWIRVGLSWGERACGGGSLCDKDRFHGMAYFVDGANGLGDGSRGARSRGCSGNDSR